jgi:hypothetical protein
LEDLYLSVLIAARELGVRLRPELSVGESFHAEEIVDEKIRAGALESDSGLLDLLITIRSEAPPAALLRGIIKCFKDRYVGLESLALGSVIERPTHLNAIRTLIDIPGTATSPEQKIALVRAWLRCWQRPCFWLSRMPQGWWLKDINPRSGNFKELERRLVSEDARRIFKREWLPTLLERFTERMEVKKHRLKGSELSLLISNNA